MPFALTGARIFDGERFLDGHAVVVDGLRIGAVLPEADLPARMHREPLSSGLLAPGFIDVQVNGGGGALLNDARDGETVQRSHWLILRPHFVGARRLAHGLLRHHRHDRVDLRVHAVDLLQVRSHRFARRYLPVA